MKASIKKPFWDVDLRQSHEGLRQHASRRGYKLSDLGPGEAYLFVNVSMSAYKILMNVVGEKDSLGIVSSYRSPHGRMELGAIQYLPKTWDDKGFFDYEDK
jgi:hypothetical protein